MSQCFGSDAESPKIIGFPLELGHCCTNKCNRQMLVTVKVFFLAPPALPSGHSISYTSGKQLAVLAPVDFCRLCSDRTEHSGPMTVYGRLSSAARTQYYPLDCTGARMVSEAKCVENQMGDL